MVHYQSTVYHFLSASLHLDMNNILQMIQEHFLTYNVYYVKLNTYKNNFYIQVTLVVIEKTPIRQLTFVLIVTVNVVLIKRENGMEIRF
jgi:hypothetical protein